MSNNDYKITHSNYVLRTKHQSVSGGTVYERNFMTTTNLGQWDSGSIPYGESNFRFVYRPTSGIRKRQSSLDWKEWNGADVANYEKTREDEPRLKPNYSSLLDFAYFGSCTELVKSTISKIINTFPATLVVGDEFDVGPFGKARVVTNPFGMDVTSDRVPDGAENRWRYMCEAYSAYTANGSNITSFSVTTGESCNYTGSIWNTIRLGSRVIYEVYFIDGLRLFTKNMSKGATISPKAELIDKFFDGLDDFSSLLLNRETEPIYSARLDWPHETDRGVETYKRTLTWPSREDGSIVVDSFTYDQYISDLLDLSKFYDEHYTDNLWRMLTHDSIKNMDLTFTRPEKDEDAEDYNIGTGRFQGLMWAVGRQFDDIKREVANIQNATRITYRGDNNVPDYYLFDTLSLSGWETYDVGEPLSGVTVKAFYDSQIGTKDYDYTDASVEFLKNLKLNTGNIFRRKGTKYAIENLLGLFGLVSRDFARMKYRREHNGQEPDWSDSTDYCNPSVFDYRITEYVTVANGPDSESFVEQVREWNKLRNDFPTSIDDMDITDFYGIPVAEVITDDKVYLVPWFNKDEKYSAGTYFQMKGGWPEETIKYLHAVDTYADLQNVPDEKLFAHRTCYVVDISDYTGTTESHYFRKTDSGEWVSTDMPAAVESIIENFEGNNPHVGYGWYDAGQEYINRLSDLFKYERENDSPENQMFRDDAYECNTGELGLSRLGFSLTKKGDSQKVWYFHNGGEENVCRNLNGSDVKYTPGNPQTFETEMRPHNFEGGAQYEEGAANSVVNLKNIHIEFYTCNKYEYDEHGHLTGFEPYFKKCILPYLLQIIPSTAIFTYHIMSCNSVSPLNTTAWQENQNVNVAGIIGDHGEPNNDVVFNYNVYPNGRTNYVENNDNE